jgi:hypothetical protein
MAQPTTPFRTDRERDAYRLLRDSGEDALIAAYGDAAADHLMTRWEDNGLIRIGRGSDGGYTVRTFAKYTR